jgi:uncharacterized protein (TIGR02452 family)
VGLHDLEELSTNRVTKILQSAAAAGYGTIILGAVGGGAYGNHRDYAARAFKTVLVEVLRIRGVRVLQ